MMRWAIVGPMPWMYWSATMARFSLGMSTPAIRGMLALPLLVLRVHADHAHHAAALDRLAQLADALDGRSDLHGFRSDPGSSFFTLKAAGSRTASRTSQKKRRSH